MKNFSYMLALVAVLAAPMVSQAAVVQTTGSGSAVTTADASANFENADAVTANPYVEDGLSFFRTGLSNTNNGCGYGGCSYHVPFRGFSGNFMYSTGIGYFTIAATGNNTFSGLEFIVGSGFGDPATSAQWQALNNGVLLESGSFTSPVGSTVGFLSVSGFDELRFGTFGNNFIAPAFDTVRAQYVNVQAVPEPVSIALFGLGLAGVAAVRRKVAKTL